MIQFESFNAIIGMNGIGKTTILNAIAQLKIGLLSSATKWKHAATNAIQKIMYYFKLFDAIENDNYIFMPGEYIVELTEKDIRLLLNDKIKSKSSLDLLFYGDKAKSDCIKPIRNAGFYPNLSKVNKYDVYLLDSIQENSSNAMYFLKAIKEIYYNLRKIETKNDEILFRFNNQRYGLLYNRELLNSSNTIYDNVNMYFDLDQNFWPLIKDYISIIYMDQIRSLTPFKEKYVLGDNFNELPMFDIFLKQQNRILSELLKQNNADKADFGNIISKDLINWLQNQKSPLNNFKFVFSINDNQLEIFAKIDNDRLVAIKMLSLGQQWLTKFVIHFFDQLYLNKENSIILIDEPGQSLHPLAQKEIKQFLDNFNVTNQVIYTTHMPDLLDLKKKNSILLIEKDENNSINFKVSNEILKVYDQLIGPDEYQTALIFQRNNYSMISKGLELNLQMINRLHNFFFNTENIEMCKMLGTAWEDPTARIVQNSHFLLTKTQIINLNEDFHSKITNEPAKILIFQLHKILNNLSSNIENKTYKQNRFTKLTKFWNPNPSNDQVLTYNPIIAKDLCKKLDKFLLQEEIIAEIDSMNSILVFPENVIPYSYLDKLIEFAAKYNVIIIAGMEHQTFRHVRKILSDLTEKYSKPKLNSELLFNSLNNSFQNDDYINLAVIINAHYGIYFQVKNNPVYKPKYNIEEKIPLCVYQKYNIFDTIVGKLCIFICKDFLVNYCVIPNWMDLNGVNRIIIPSFTDRVNPFITKLREITNSSNNTNKIFVYANLAEYGGSNIIGFSNRDESEPGEEDHSMDNSEGVGIWKCDSKNQINFIKKISI